LARSAAKSAPQLALHKLGLQRDIDLALHLPLRYEDETRVIRLADAQIGATVQIDGVVTHHEVRLRPRRQLLLTLDDGSGTCLLRFLNFYPTQQKAWAVGSRLRVRGELQGGLLGYHMTHPACKPSDGRLPESLTPVYPSVAGLPQSYLRKAIQGGLSRADLSETLSPEARLSLQRVFSPGHELISLRSALQLLHQPQPGAMQHELNDRSHPAWQRLKAEELLAQQLSQLMARQARFQFRAPALTGAETLHSQLLSALPFELTPAQQRVEQEIATDLAREVPMHRLLQGDVGSGKTVVAALAACVCMDAGWQCALMAPTEILAEQHLRKMVAWLAPLGVTVAWLSGSQKKKERAEMLAQIASGSARLVVGTHAVIQKQVQFQGLALAIIDEQHRFGVAQRLALRDKSTRGLEPHLLMMTATPIPRTLAMSYYADLDVSTIDTLPPGRSPIVTKVVSNQRRAEVISRIRTQLAQGRQVYWVCPLIEESEAMDLSNATATHAELQAALADLQPPVQVGLLHSRQSAAEKKAVMAQFAIGPQPSPLDLMGVLVSTTVIEVGVDIPNASLMVIEHAERFGLSQLHQLRGRVGRGTAVSACVLLYTTSGSAKLSELACERLRAMAETQDGFEIARRDLDLRGPGEFLGARQSGATLLRFADLSTDTRLLTWAHQAAQDMLARHNDHARKHVARWLGKRLDFIKA
jgi:ATP-dependent DNA helicase RecG